MFKADTIQILLNSSSQNPLKVLKKNKRQLPFFRIVGFIDNKVIINAEIDDVNEIVSFLEEEGIEVHIDENQ